VHATVKGCVRAVKFRPARRSLRGLASRRFTARRVPELHGRSRWGCGPQLLYRWPKGKIVRALPVKRSRGGEAHRRGPTRRAL